MSRSVDQHSSAAIGDPPSTGAGVAGSGVGARSSDRRARGGPGWRGSPATYRYPGRSIGHEIPPDDEVQAIRVVWFDQWPPRGLWRRIPAGTVVDRFDPLALTHPGAFRPVVDRQAGS